MKAYCLKCKNDTNHTILKEEKNDYHDEDGDIWAEHRWQIIQCNGCENISFQEISINSEDRDPEDGSFFENKKNYPLPNKGNLLIKNYYNVPYKVRNIYREVIDAYNNGMYVLCAAGLRAIIEGICNQEGITSGLVESILDEKVTLKRKKDLQGKISGLFEKGFLTKKHSNLLHEHRFLGNEAIHSLDNPSKDELVLAIEIVEHTLDNIYELDEKVEDLRFKRAIRLKKKK
ncbi:DUF4145 domain-containing protein [Rufibacter sp. LB8]|uniref:DUF4145 domain-containing protein n=1 Tax=Rufibacter sp. LB8 TaxID=2777781 RepID=UPI00178C4185|nr:DUF4145 domain-containing protein [Rufibacter sp. LB8]